MTIAVCMACGGEKHGALASCHRCGFAPSSPIDKARSCMLTRPPLSTEDLTRFQAMIQTSQRANYEYQSARRVELALSNALPGLQELSQLSRLALTGSGYSYLFSTLTIRADCA